MYSSPADLDPILQFFFSYVSSAIFDDAPLNSPIAIGEFGSIIHHAS